MPTSTMRMKRDEDEHLPGFAADARRERPHSIRSFALAVRLPETLTPGRPIEYG